MSYLERIQHYWDLRAQGYSEKSVQELHSEDAVHWTEMLQEWLPENTNLSCLDIGCGPGFLGLLLAKLGHTVTFCDYAKNMLQEARRNAEKEGFDCTFELGDATNPPFPAQSFDVIVCRNLVWNLEDPELAYRQWLTLLKPNGRLLIFDGNHYLYQYDQRYRAEKTTPQYKDPHTKERMKGVDPNIMANIAKDLPLSRLERPYWDLDFFINEKVRAVHTKPYWKSFTDRYGAPQSVIESFTICVET